MIFVAVGTQKFPFDRLLKKLDELKGQGVIQDELFAQIGYSTYVPKHYQSADFLTKEEFDEKIALCDFVITHSGGNTIVSALRAHKKVIVFPRLEKYGEHVDDHQCQIANAFRKNNYVLVCTDEDELAERISQIPGFEPTEYRSQRKNVVQTIDQYLQETEEKKINGRRALQRRHTAKKNRENVDTEDRKIRVLMCGSDPDLVGGGMVSVIRQYLGRDGEDGYFYQYVPTHIEDTKVRQSIYFLKAYCKIAGLLVTRKVDLVHLHIAERGSSFRKSFLVRLCRICRVKVILHNHAAELEDFYDSLPGFLKSYLRRTYEMADTVLVLSDQMTDRIRRVAPQASMQVLRNAVPVPDENPYDSERSSLLMLGRLGSRKGVYDLLEVLKQIDDQLPPEAECFLCGDGEVEKVREYVQRNGLAHRVTWVGWADGAQRQKLMELAGIHILPSYHEGLPMAILETMAAGIPNISTEIASIPEVIEHGRTGLLIRPGDREALAEAILSLLSDKKKREALSRDSHACIQQHFSLDVHMKELHRIYDAMLR